MPVRAARRVLPQTAGPEVRLAEPLHTVREQGGPKHALARARKSWKRALPPERSVHPTAFELATSATVVKLGLRTSLIIGSLLNLINQGGSLFGDGQLDLVKLGLTYLVPYCVATYSATSVLLQRAGSPASRG
jgi:hypothetical protein